MAKKIYVDYGLKSEIHRQLGHGMPVIRRALNGADDTDTQRRIRAYALANGGVEAAERTEKKWRKVDGKTWVQDTSACFDSAQQPTLPSTDAQGPEE